MSCQVMYVVIPCWTNTLVVLVPASHAYLCSMVVRSVESALDKLTVGRVTRKIILYSPEIDAAIFLKMSSLMVLVNVRLVLMLFLDVSVVIFFLGSLSATLVELFTKNPAPFAVNQVIINILMVQVDVVHAFPPLSGVLPVGSPMV